MRVRRPQLTSGAIIALLGLAGCGGDAAPARDEWVVVVTTDAPLPQFGDRLLLEVLDGTGSTCPTCRREVGAGEAWPVSFGVAKTSDGAVRVRARLYRSAYAGSDGLPQGSAVIDAVGALPSAQGLTNVHLHLALDCFGVAADVAHGLTCSPATAALVEVPILSPPPEVLPSVGSSPLAASSPCAGNAPSEMVCVPGGAFILGAPRVASADVSDPAPEHLVTLGPFALDRDEITVGVVRALVQAGKLPGEPHLRSTDPALLAFGCTYLGTGDATNDSLPVNCLPAALAEAVCSALGKRLPTEAEWEFAAGNRVYETEFPWGASDDVCGRAIVSNGYAGQGDPVYCEGLTGRAAGAAAPGSASDTTFSGIRDMGGNVSEWVADEAASYASPCWSSPRLHDPLCDEPDLLPGFGCPGRSIRGGSFRFPELAAHPYFRVAGCANLVAADLGVRCARSL